TKISGKIKSNKKITTIYQYPDRDPYEEVKNHEDIKEFEYLILPIKPYLIIEGECKIMNNVKINTGNIYTESNTFYRISEANFKPKYISSQ
ncbi:MAG: hypothetical protein ACTSPQ_08970, partial [Candidatus Helarchaeota archaeon]